MSDLSAFTNDDVEQILRVVDRLTDVEVRFESADLKLHVRKFSGAAPTPAETRKSEPALAETKKIKPNSIASGAETIPTGTAAPEIPRGAVAIRAPMLGMFYRAPSPSEPSYVDVGKRVVAHDPVCIIEVMKLFNTINAGVNGTILAILVENGAMVEYNQVLFLVQPE